MERIPSLHPLSKYNEPKYSLGGNGTGNLTVS